MLGVGGEAALFGELRFALGLSKNCRALVAREASHPPEAAYYPRPRACSISSGRSRGPCTWSARSSSASSSFSPSEFGPVAVTRRRKRRFQLRVRRFSYAGACVEQKDYFASLGLIMRGAEPKAARAMALRKRVLDGLAERELLVDGRR